MNALERNRYTEAWRAFGRSVPRPRAILVVLGIILAAIVMIEIVQVARGVLVWIFIAVFLASALNPAVDWLQARGVRRRGAAVAVTYVGALL